MQQIWKEFTVAILANIESTKSDDEYFIYYFVRHCKEESGGIKDGKEEMYEFLSTLPFTPLTTFLICRFIAS